MSHPPTPEPADVNPGYYLPVEDSSTQMNDEDFNLLEQTRDASTQTVDEEVILPKTTRDASTQTSKEDFGVLQQIIDKRDDPTVTSESSKQNRKRNVSSDKMITHDRDAHKRSRLKICEMSEKVISIFNEQGGINPDSRMDISATKVSDSERSKGKILVSVDILAILSPSRPHENIPQSNFSLENLQNIPRLISQTVEEMKKTSMCLACNKKKISEHVKVHEGKNMFTCCQCRYKIGEMDYLLTHICREHLSEPFFCNICKVRFAEVDSHESEHPCNVCEENLQCITRLENHYLIHEEHHSEFCSICKSEIGAHATKLEERDVYKCCCSNCPHEYPQRGKLLQHLYTHSKLKLFKCDYCGERFTLKRNRLVHLKIHSKCEICGKTFVDRNSLDAHRLEEHP